MWFSPGPGRMIFVHFLDRGDKNKKKITLEAWRNISKVWLSTKRAERGFHQEYNNPRRQTFNIQKNNAAANVSITIWRIFFTDFNSSVESTFCRLPLNVQKKGKKKNPTVASHATPFFLISAVIILVISKKASHFHTQIYGSNEIVWVSMLFWYALNEVLNPLNAKKMKEN